MNCRRGGGDLEVGDANGLPLIGTNVVRLAAAHDRGADPLATG
jgi:hypothetical protein